MSRQECKMDMYDAEVNGVMTRMLMEANGVEGNDIVEVNDITTGMQNGHVWCGGDRCHNGNNVEVRIAIEMKI